MEFTGLVRAHSNIALVKYWGKRNESLILPMNNNLSLTLDGLYTETQVKFSDALDHDTFVLNGKIQDPSFSQKTFDFLDLFRKDFDFHLRAEIKSVNHVPTGAGLASSASAFAALSGAINEAMALNLSERDLSIYARQGSGSASRSIFGGFVQWHKGEGNDSSSSYGEPFDDGNWDVGMIVLLLNRSHKKIPSRLGMQQVVKTSSFYPSWPKVAEQDFEYMKEAILERDVDKMGEIAERNALTMHATTLAANPPFTYFEPETLEALNHVQDLRKEGFSAYATMDAGPNVKILCRQSEADAIISALSPYYQEDQLLFLKPGPGIERIDQLEEDYGRFNP